MLMKPNILIRAVATAAVWSIAAVVVMRLRHPMVALSIGAIALGLTIVIWLPSSQK